MSKNSRGIETARKVNFLTLKVITQYPMDFYFLGVRLKVDIRLWISDDYPFSGRVNASAFSVR